MNWNRLIRHYQTITRWEEKRWRGCMYPQSQQPAGKSTNGSFPIPLPVAVHCQKLGMMVAFSLTEIFLSFYRLKIVPNAPYIDTNHILHIYDMIATITSHHPSDSLFHRFSTNCPRIWLHSQMVLCTHARTHARTCTFVLPKPRQDHYEKIGGSLINGVVYSEVGGKIE